MGNSSDIKGTRMGANGGAVTVRRLMSVSEAQREELSRVLIDCVEGGASVSFMSPLSPASAMSFWRMVGDDVMQGHRALLVAEHDGGIVGTLSTKNSRVRSLESADTTHRECNETRDSARIAGDG